LKQTRSPGFPLQLSPTLFSTSLFFSPALPVNVTSSLWSPSSYPWPRSTKIKDAVCVLFWFPKSSVILSCIIPKEPEPAAPKAPQADTQLITMRHALGGFFHI
jgi:hypothetical protein